MKAVFQLEKKIIRDHSTDDIESFFRVIDSVPEAVNTFREQIGK